MTDLTLSAEQIRQFEEDGYLILEKLLDPEDVERILRIARCDPQLAADAKGNQNYEGEGLDTRLAYRPGLADDVYSALARSRRLVEPLEQLFGDRVLYYYQLQMLKDPQTGGWQYHQDYGYHYEQFFYPAFASVMVALDPATRANGCLKVVRGSNRLGRLEHQSSGSQLIADPPESCNGTAGNGGSALRTGAGIGPILSRQHPARLRAKSQLAAALVAYLRVRGCL